MNKDLREFNPCSCRYYEHMQVYDLVYDYEDKPWLFMELRANKLSFLERLKLGLLYLFNRMPTLDWGHWYAHIQDSECYPVHILGEFVHACK